MQKPPRVHGTQLAVVADVTFSTMQAPSGIVDGICNAVWLLAVVAFTMP